MSNNLFDIEVTAKNPDVPKPKKNVKFIQSHDDFSTESEFDIPEETIESKPPKVKKPKRVPKYSMPAADSESDSIVELEAVEGSPPKKPKLKPKNQPKTSKPSSTSKPKGTFQIIHHIIPAWQMAKDLFK